MQTDGQKRHGDGRKFYFDGTRWLKFRAIIKSLLYFISDRVLIGLKRWLVLVIESRVPIYKQVSDDSSDFPESHRSCFAFSLMVVYSVKRN